MYWNGSAARSVTDRAGIRICALDVSSTARGDPLQVLVRDNNIDQALRVLKKKMQREGVFREMKRRRSFEKPSERKVREKAEAARRARKLARKQAIRDGLIAAPPKKPRLLAPKFPAQGQLPPRTSGPRES